MPQELERVVVVYEPEAAARDRLVAHGYTPAIAEEIAVYLAQATDLAEASGELRDELTAAGIAVEFVELDALPLRIPELSHKIEGTILWCQTDGIRFYRGSVIPAMARLLGLARYGSPPGAQHLCQDKFASATVAAAAGLPVPPALLLEGDDAIAAVGDAEWDSATLFVKPATLGAKIGIFADSRCTGLGEARRLSRRLWDRYQDRAVVQPFVASDDVRVSFMHTGGDFAAQLGIAKLAKDPRGETGGAFLTMLDNQTLSGAKDTSGARGGFGLTREAAFVPRMTDLKGARDPSIQRTVAAITGAAARLARLLRLEDYFSMDFRVDAAGNPSFLEFEVCPAVTIYDFQDYLRNVHGIGLGTALSRSLRIAYRRRLNKAEA